MRYPGLLALLLFLDGCREPDTVDGNVLRAIQEEEARKQEQRNRALPRCNDCPPHENYSGPPLG